MPLPADQVVVLAKMADTLDEISAACARCSAALASIGKDLEHARDVAK